MRGRLRSRRMRSGRGASALTPSRRRNAIASTPSVATRMSMVGLASSKTSRVRRTSPGLSSTSKTVMNDLGLLTVIAARGCRQREVERRAFTRLRLDGDDAAVALDDLLADSEADAGAGEFVAFVQTLEHPKDALEVARIDADAVVADREGPAVVAVARGRNVDPGYAGALVLD